MGTVELELFTIPVDCSEGDCIDPSDGSVVEPSWMRRWAFISTQTTKYEPEGRYLHFQVVGPDGALGQVEIDVPEDPSLGEPAVSYVELVGEETTFEADAAEGWIQLAADALGENCPCADGRFDLLFRSRGEDGEVGTDDDVVRRLSRARVTLDDEFCVDPVRRRELGEGRLDVEIVDRCPTFTPRPRPTPSSTPPSSYPATSSGGCEDDSTTPYESSGGGCDGDGSSSSGGGCDDGGSGSSGGGCEGDTSSSGSGCEGDTSSSGSGCEGDGSSSGSGCEGDASSASLSGERRPRCRTGRRAVLAGPIQTPLLVALVLGLQRLRRRRR